MIWAMLIGAVVTLTNDGPAKTVHVATFDRPQLTTSRWMVRGKVRYRDVEGRSYLETWNSVAGGEYFSRDFITGSSDWRDFVLPFDASGAGGPPQRIVLNVAFAGKGTVELDQIEVLDQPSAWFTEPEAGGIFGVLGSVFGVLAGLMGALAGAGRARAAAFTIWRALVMGGAVSVGLGVLAVIDEQPPYVLACLFGFGSLGLMILVPMRSVLRRRYESHELRRMEAMDRAV
jgi:hypothetical protein